MTDVEQDLSDVFGQSNTSLPPEILGELQSILRLHSITAQELFYKWESYSIKMGAEDVQLDLKTTRDFKRDLQETLERETRGKAHARSTDKKAVGATPRQGKSGADVFGMIDGLMPNTPRLPMNAVNGNSIKRRNEFETPTSKASKARLNSSPSESKTTQGANGIGVQAAQMPFSERQNAGQVMETLNDHIPTPSPPVVPFAEPRIKIKANTDLSKFSYKPMGMKLSAASEILDDRIDEFFALTQQAHGLDEGSFGNPASQSTNEIIAVGRIASDTLEGKLNAASVVLETSRRTGAGVRIPLKLDSISSYDLFPGKLVALRGSNVAGDSFAVKEILEMPLLPPAASSVAEIDAVETRLKQSEDLDTAQPLNMVMSSGPYTSDSNLDFEPLHALCEHALSTSADALILLGPFLDVEHPMLASGDIPPLPSSINTNADTATLTDVFQGLVSLPLQHLAQRLSSITIILVPSVRDIINKHVSFPQDRMVRKELSLPKQASFVTNPVTLSLNEIVVGISTQDILYELRREECTGGKLSNGKENVLHRLSRHLIEQRHFFPLFPPTARANLPRPTPVNDGAETSENIDDGLATGAMLDVSYLSLAEMLRVRPDVLITPSSLAPFAKVVESVVVVNPGTLSKKKGAGTFAQMYVGSRKIEEKERNGGELIANQLPDRARVDIVRV